MMTSRYGSSAGFGAGSIRLAAGAATRLFCFGVLMIIYCSVASEDPRPTSKVRDETEATMSSPLGPEKLSDTAITSRRPPNILLFQPDDLPWLASWEEALSRFDGNPNNIFRRNLDTPYMNSIRSAGVVFTNAVQAGSVCAESRASTIMGRYNSRGIFARDASRDIENSLLADQVSVSVTNTRLTGKDLELNLPNAMRTAGYRTGAAGKWHLRSTFDAEARDGGPVFEDWPEYSNMQQFVRDAGFDWADGIYDHNIIEPYLQFSHNMEWVTARAKGFISESKAMDKPFMMYFNPTTPHDPDVYTALFNYTLLDTPAGTLSSIPDSGMPSRAEMWRKAQEVLTAEEIATAGTTGVPFNAVSQALGIVVTDESLGALMRHMEELGVLENTVIMVKADHGLIEKSAIYQGGALVPFFATGPAPFDKPQTISKAVSSVDIAPTMMDIAGSADYPYLTDGQSFLPLLRGDKAFRNVVFNEDYVNRAVWGPNSMKLIHLNNVTENIMPAPTDLPLVPVLELHPGAASVYQLYNLTADPEEQMNLFYNKEYSLEAKKLLRGLLCFESKLRLSAENTDSVRIDDCKAMVSEGDQGESQGRVNRTHEMFPSTTWFPTVMMKSDSSRVSAQEAGSLSSSGWMGSLFGTQMIESFLTSIVRGFGSKTSSIPINGQ